MPMSKVGPIDNIICKYTHSHHINIDCNMFVHTDPKNAFSIVRRCLQWILCSTMCLINNNQSTPLSAHCTNF